MILCQCAGVTEESIRQLIAEGADTVKAISRNCGAGRCCSPCRAEIARLLYRSRGKSVYADQRSCDLRTEL